MTERGAFEHAQVCLGMAAVGMASSRSDTAVEGGVCGEGEKFVMGRWVNGWMDGWVGVEVEVLLRRSG